MLGTRLLQSIHSRGNELAKEGTKTTEGKNGIGIQRVSECSRGWSNSLTATITDTVGPSISRRALVATLRVINITDSSARDTRVSIARAQTTLEESSSDTTIIETQGGV
eukprot:CCRYP_007154-RB/>CCRYP_007154-RB protein AED:0.44 eAED:0.45 QI:0/0/0.5/1/0/0/2/650/108